VQRKGRPRYERVDGIEQVRAPVAHDEHRLLALAGLQVVVISQNDIGTVRGDDTPVEGEVLRLGDSIQFARVEQFVELRERRRGNNAHAGRCPL